MVADVIDPVANQTRKPKSRLPPELREQAGQLARGGLSASEIAKRLNVNPRTVRYWGMSSNWHHVQTEPIAQAVTREVKRVAQHAEKLAAKQLQELIPRLTAQAREAILVNSDAGPCIANQVKALVSNKLSVDELESVSRTWERSMKVHRTTLGLDSDGVQLKLAVGIRLDSTPSQAPIDVEIIEVNPTSTPLGQVDVEKV